MTSITLVTKMTNRITFKAFVNESINDKGLFKTIFVIGLPGAGKSYTVKQLSGTISPKIVNTDRAVEFLSAKYDKAATSSNWFSDFRDSSVRITIKSLYYYVDGMLPLFVDGTSNDLSNIQHRMGILESLGYDVGVIYVHADLDVAIRRAEERAEKIKRHVDKEFIESVFTHSEENAQYLMSKVGFSKKIVNNDQLDNQLMQKLFVSSQSFFSSPVKNPIGKRVIEELKENGDKYLVPSIISDQVLQKKIDGWYKG